MSFVPRPAPLPKRVIAGLLDTAFIVVLSGISVAIPLITRGVVLPMWGVLAVMVGYAVVPLAFFKRTIGLHIMGLEVVTKEGHAVDLANLLFRELVGRGFFPAAWLITIISSLIAFHFQVGASKTPPVLAGVMTVASSIALLAAAVGHFIALSRPDQRTLADLLARSFVVEGPALPPPSDLEEFDEWKASRVRTIIGVCVFEVFLAASVLALPALLMSSSGESSQEKIARLKFESIKAKWEANQGSDSLTADLQREYDERGMEAESQAVGEKHRIALSMKEADRELQLREKLSQTHDRDTAQTLINLLERQDRVDDAVEVYREWLGPTPKASELAGFGNWLATNNRTELAVTELERAIAIDPLVPLGHVLLGVSYQRLGRYEDARVELEYALLDDPKDEDADDALRVVEGKIGRLTAKSRDELKHRFESWQRDAGPARE